MAAANKKPAASATKAAAPAVKRTPLTPERAPSPRVSADPRDGNDAGTDNTRDPAVDAAVDKEATDAVRAADAVVAAAPTPNQNNDLEDANKHPGAGGLANAATLGGTTVGPRKRAKLASDEEVEVEPTTKHFQMLDDNHQMHVYPVGTTRMPKEHAEHWYAEANGVVIK
jgi:hypothetical protein